MFPIFWRESPFKHISMILIMVIYYIPISPLLYKAKLSTTTISKFIQSQSGANSDFAHT